VEISKARIRAFFRSGWERQGRRTRRILKRLPVVFLILGVGLCIFSVIRIVQVTQSQKSQIAAELWAGDSGNTYRQISCFAVGQTQADGGPDKVLSSDRSLGIQDILTIRKSLDTIVKESSGMDTGKGNDSNTPEVEITNKLWIDAYSADAKCTVERKATELQAEAFSEVMLTGVSGDYYLFHPLQMVDGAFLSDDTLDSKKIVLDKELAFKLFRTYNVVGSKVSINGRSYTIVGVVRHADNKIDRKAYGDYLRAYVFFDELAYLSAPDPEKEVSAEPDSSNLAIMCYEVVLPNKLRNIALQNLITSMEAAGKTEKNFLFVDNTNRFSLLRLYDTVFPIGENTDHRMLFKLPFWEVSAQTAESILVFWWILECTGIILILTSIPGIYLSRKKERYTRI